MAPTVASQERAALKQFLAAYLKLKALGWKPMGDFRATKLWFEMVEAGSTGVFRCTYDEVNYAFTIHDTIAGKTYETFPALWRPLKEQPK